MKGYDIGKLTPQMRSSHDAAKRREKPLQKRIKATGGSCTANLVIYYTRAATKGSRSRRKLAFQLMHAFGRERGRERDRD